MSQSSLLSSIVTPYDPRVFQQIINHYGLHSQFPSLVHDLVNGFHIGLPSHTPFSTSIIPPPRSSRLDPIIEKDLLDERQAGRMLGPFSLEEIRQFYGNLFAVAPLHAKEKTNPDGSVRGYRIIRDISWPGQDGFSVNDLLNTDDIPPEGGSPQAVANIIATAPPGLQAATFDIESAYRTIPIWPADRKFLLVRHGDQFWIDLALPFGLSTAPGILGVVTNFIYVYLRRLGLFAVLKWVDDFVVFRAPTSRNWAGGFIYVHDENWFLKTTEALGVPWNKEKGQPFADTFVYHGFQWSISRRTVTLLPEKQTKLVEELKEFLAECSSHTPVKQYAVQRIHGSLNYVTFVVNYGRSYMPSLQDWISQFNNPSVEGMPKPEESIPVLVKKDLEWWLDTLSRPAIPRDLSPLAPAKDLGIWVDASTDWGIGLVWRHNYYAA